MARGALLEVLHEPLGWLREPDKAGSEPFGAFRKRGMWGPDPKELGAMAFSILPLLLAAAEQSFVKPDGALEAFQVRNSA